MNTPDATPTSTPTPTRADFRFFHRLRVRWAEVDMQKIVFNAHYLTYFDTAIADYWRALAMPYDEAMLQLEGDIFLRKATVDYRAPARSDDLLDVAMKCRHIGRSSMRFDGALFRQSQLLVGCELVYVFADPASHTSQAVPAPLRDMLTAYEAGEPMTQVQTGDWSALGDSAAALRRQVFVHEQGVPEELEWDLDDARSLHAVVRNRLGQAVGTARLLPADAQGVAHIGRVAVHRVLRGEGLGHTLMAALEQAARSRGDRAIALNAQCSAEGFYARQGYAVHGAPFVEAGIDHVEMRKAL